MQFPKSSMPSHWKVTENSQGLGSPTLTFLKEVIKLNCNYQSGTRTTFKLSKVGGYEMKHKQQNNKVKIQFYCKQCSVSKLSKYDSSLQSSTRGLFPAADRSEEPDPTVMGDCLPPVPPECLHWGCERNLYIKTLQIRYQECILLG